MAVNSFTEMHIRELLKGKSGRNSFYTGLANSGYVPQTQPFLAMCNAIFMATPIILEGERGGGKTAFPEAVAKCLNYPLYNLPCFDDTSSDHILFQWDSNGQQHYLTEALSRNIPLAEAQKKQWTADFIKFGEVLDAFHYSSSTGKPCVLLIDEIDKLSSNAESTLLQILARGYSNIPKLRPDPRIGFIPEYDPVKRKSAFPIVVLTSNDLGSGVSAPLRSRARYAYIESPTTEEMVKVLAVRVPEASPRILYESSKLIQGVSGLPLLEKPALREFIMLLETFVGYDFKYLNEDIIRASADCLAKRKKDVQQYLDSVDNLFFNFVKKEDQEMDHLVREIYKARQAGRLQFKSYAN